MAVSSPSRCVFARVWEILPRTLELLESMGKHKASANCIKIKDIDKECVIASSDGACIIWDLVEARTRPLNPFCFFSAETDSHHSNG
ncbi:hypothetical protein VZT92_007923 [Zoarces viviparus]|uniref:Uncharacterized protein n=1 Tax=Zoarces viviparus TaxID=48416 RepID=A0AAW1FMW9_ZOAVI